MKTSEQHKTQVRSIVYGAAVGDALGVPYEFKERDTFECTGMVGQGSHHAPRGTFSDDTSLLLANCDSIRACRRIDVADMRRRFERWYYRGAYTADGRVFGVGRTTITALESGHGCTDDRSNGNGSLMRIAPLALTNATDDEIREASAVTHAHPLSCDACVMYVHILRDLLNDRFAWHIETYLPQNKRFAFMHDIAELDRGDIRSSGYVLDTLSASLWCLHNTESYKDCVVEAVNLGSDTDTTACVAGALAGAKYGYDSIPAEWIEQLRGKEVIERCLF